MQVAFTLSAVLIAVLVAATEANLRLTTNVGDLVLEGVTDVIVDGKPQDYLRKLANSGEGHPVMVELVHEEDSREESYRMDAENLFPLDRKLAITCPSAVIGSVNTATCTSIGCTAKDLSYLSCELVPVDAAGNVITSSCLNCNCGDQVSVKVRCKIRNDTGSARQVAWVIGTLQQSGSCPTGPISESCAVGLCDDSSVLASGVVSERTFSTVLKWVCGSTVKLTSVTLGGAPTSSTCSGYTRCNAFGPKCDKPAEFKIDTPLGPPSPTATCSGNTQNQIVSYTITGGKGSSTSPYSVSIACSSPAATYSETRTTTGTFTKEISNCVGVITVTVNDPSNCPKTGTVTAPVCCFNNLSCKALSPLGPFNACDASQVTVPVRTLGDVFNVNAEACGGTPAFSSNVVYNPSATSVCSGVTVTRTYTAVPKDSSGNPDAAHTKTCSETWSVSSTTLPTITPGPNETLECTGANDPGDRKGQAVATAQCGPPMITQSKSVVNTPSNCAAVTTVTLTLTATDQCGRTASANQVITYTDTTPPVFTGTCAAPLDDVALSCASTTIPAASSCTASDTCSAITVTPSCCSLGDKLQRTWTIRDTCGNPGATTRTQFVTFGSNSCLPV